MLTINACKTENTQSIVGHSDMATADQNAWRNTRKLGSLLGAEKDVARRFKLRMF